MSLATVERDGRYSTDKAPGVSVLAAMHHAPARLAIPAEAWTMPMLLRLGRVGSMLCALALLPPAALALAIVLGPRWSLEQRLWWANFVARSSGPAPS